MNIELVKVSEIHLPLLEECFSVILESHDDLFFHPHPFTCDNAKKIACKKGLDSYYLMKNVSEIISYGMLRGMDDGYRIPSLGIYVAPKYRGNGYGRLMMQYLHANAKDGGFEKIRLSVDCANIHAISLYKAMGYIFEAPIDNRLIGYCQLLK